MPGRAESRTNADRIASLLWFPLLFFAIPIFAAGALYAIVETGLQIGYHGGLVFLADLPSPFEKKEIT